MGDNSEPQFYSVVPKTPEQRKLSIPIQPICDTRLMNNVNNKSNGAVRTGAASIAKTIVPTITKTPLKFQNCKIEDRPPFVTVVPKKKFLPSKFDLLFEKSLFTFSSLPKPVEVRNTFQKSGSHSSPGFRRIQLSPPRGVHDYYNVMWDPHVHRGNTASQFKASKESLPGLVPQTPDSHEASKGILRKKRSSTFQSQTQLGSSYHTGKNPYKLNTQRVYSNTHTSMSIEDRLHRLVQTEIKFLEELGPDSGALSDATVQTEPIYELDPFSPITSPPPQVKSFQEKHGIDVGTQILAGELFNFDQEIEPILQSLVGKIIEQAMYETVEEEEIAALKEQRYRFQEQRRLEELELQRLQEQQRKIRVEKEQLVKNLEKETNILPDYNEIRRKFGNQNNKHDESLCSTSYLLEILPSVLNTLRQEGFILNDKLMLVPSEEVNEVSDSNKDDNEDSQVQDHEPMIDNDVGDDITKEKNSETKISLEDEGGIINNASSTQNSNNETDPSISDREEFIGLVNEGQSIIQDENLSDSLLCSAASQEDVIETEKIDKLEIISCEIETKRRYSSSNEMAVTQILAEERVSTSPEEDLLIPKPNIGETASDESLVTDKKQTIPDPEDTSTKTFSEVELELDHISRNEDDLTDALQHENESLTSELSSIIPEENATLQLQCPLEVPMPEIPIEQFQCALEVKNVLSTVDENETGTESVNIESNFSQTNAEQQSETSEKDCSAESGPGKVDIEDLDMPACVYQSKFSTETFLQSTENLEYVEQIISQGSPEFETKFSETSSQSERLEFGTTEAMIHSEEAELENSIISSDELKQAAEIVPGATNEIENDIPTPELSVNETQKDLNNSSEELTPIDKLSNQHV